MELLQRVEDHKQKIDALTKLIATKRYDGQKADTTRLVNLVNQSFLGTEAAILRDKNWRSIIGVGLALTLALEIVRIWYLA